MVTICRRFTLGVTRPEDYEILRKKLDEMGLFPIGHHTHRTKINEHEIVGVHMDFIEPEDKMNELIEYLKTDYKGRARITC